MNTDELVIVPVALAQAMFNSNTLFRILVEADSRASIAAAKTQIEAILMARHDGERNVTVITRDAVLATFDRLIGALTLGVADATVRALFLVEAIILSIVGAAAAAGYALGQGGAALIRHLYPAFPVYPPQWAVAAGLGTALVIGLLSGVMPARRAARLDPALAQRTTSHAAGRCHPPRRARARRPAHAQPVDHARHRRGDPADVDRQGHPPLRAGRVHPVRHQYRQHLAGKNQDVGAGADRHPQFGTPAHAGRRARHRTPAAGHGNHGHGVGQHRNQGQRPPAPHHGQWRGRRPAAGVQHQCQDRPVFAGRRCRQCAPVRRAGRQAQGRTVRRRQSARRARADRQRSLPRHRRARSEGTVHRDRPRPRRRRLHSHRARPRAVQP